MNRPGAAALALLTRPTWADVLFGALIQWALFVPLLAILMALGSAVLNPQTGLFFALFSALYSAPVGAGVTFLLGVPLAMLLARALRRSQIWVRHLAAFVGLGFILATLLIHVYMLVTGQLLNSSLWFSSMYVYLPIVAAAALSVGAGWSIAWHGAVVRERAALAVFAQ